MKDLQGRPRKTRLLLNIYFRFMVWFAAKSIDKRPSKSSGKNYSVPSLAKKRGQAFKLRSESVYLFSSFFFQRHSGVLSCRWSMRALLFHTPPHQKSSSTLPNQAVWKYTFCTKTSTHSRSRSTSIEGAKFPVPKATKS